MLIFKKNGKGTENVGKMSVKKTKKRQKMSKKKTKDFHF